MYPDETHSSIRRVFTPRHTPYTKRHFCGFCGTPLSFWTEQTKEQADFVCVSLNSLEDESIQKLGNMGILPSIQDSDEEERENQGAITAAQSGNREIRGQPWFEEILEGSELGKLRRRRGGKVSADGSSSVEWEIVEYDGTPGTNTPDTGRDASGSAAPNKRKHEEVAGVNDMEMK
jgi:hypothetical protein